jgi:hypothetical protein
MGVCRTHVLITIMEERKPPAWWFYPLQCEQGHPWAPGKVLVSYVFCECPPVRAAYGDQDGIGHLTVQCGEPGCRSKWYSPPHKH